LIEGDFLNNNVRRNTTKTCDSESNTTNNANEIFQNFSNLLNNQQIPDNVKDILSNMIQNANNSSNNSPEGASDNPFSNSSRNSNTIDMNTIFKIQNIMNSINNDKQNESRTNLLLSLKPYLRENKRNRVDTYIQLMKMEKVFEAINPLDNLSPGGDNKNAKH
jgi:hypothetical protein